MKSIYSRIALILIAATTFALIGTGCSTANGFGKDVEKLGEAIQDE